MKEKVAFFADSVWVKQDIFFINFICPYLRGHFKHIYDVSVTVTVL